MIPSEFTGKYFLNRNISKIKFEMSQNVNMCSFCISINKIVNFLIKCQYIL